MASNDSTIKNLFLKKQTSVVFLLVVLPLSVFVLYLGFAQWKSKRKDPAWSSSCSDFFTYNLALMEMVGAAGYVTTLYFLIAGFGDTDRSFMLGSFAWYGEMAFPMFTCLEHYVAVVHPVTYIGLKKGKGPVIRNVCAAVVWASSAALTTAVQTVGSYVLTFFVLDTCQMVVSLAAMLYCSVAVLKVLVLPKPGGAVKDKGRVHRSKRYAFSVIVLFLLVLSVRFGWNIVLSILWSFPNVRLARDVIIYSSTFLMNILASLMQPLLYLHRAGKLCRCGRPRK